MKARKQIRQIARTIRSIKQQIKSTVRQLNQEAAQLVARGNYDASKALVEKATAIKIFQSEVDVLYERWTQIGSKPNAGEKNDRTPVWEYYPIVARALLKLGGESTKREVISEIERDGLNNPKSGDLIKTNRGIPVWQQSVVRSRGPMIKEGFLERGTGMSWRLTSLGRDLAKGGGQPRVKDVASSK